MKKKIMASMAAAVIAFSMNPFMGAAVAGAAQISAPANAVKMQQTQVPGYYRLMVGKYEVTALLDGIGRLPTSLLENHTDFTKAQLDAMIDGELAPRDKDGVMIGAINAYLVNTGDHLILIDAGKGEGVAPIYTDKLGRLVDSLKASGYKPEQVDAVVFTHLHSDHIMGITHEGKRVFKNATLYLQKKDKAFWMDAPIETLPEPARPFAKDAHYTMQPYVDAGKIKVYTSGDTLFGEVQSVPLPGHTPGHTGFLFSSQGEKILFWGDVMHNVAVQMQHPEVAIDFDSDDAAARTTRLALMKKLAANKTIVAGAHIPFPGLGRLLQEGEGYRWVPVQYTVFDQH